MRQGRTTSGYTLIELAVSLVMLTIVLGGVVTATQRGLGLFRQSTANSEIDARGARAMNRVVRELIAIDGNSITTVPDTTFGASRIDYNQATGWGAAGIVLGEPRVLLFEMMTGELDNGVDDNGNGLVDEGSLVVLQNPGTADELRVVLANGVSEFLEGELDNGADDNGNGLIDESGLSFSMAGSTLRIDLSLERVGPDGNLIIRTQSTSITLRNGRDS